MLEVEPSKPFVNFGIIGCGWVARDYVAPAILSASNARLIALCDTNADSMSRIIANSVAASNNTSPVSISTHTALEEFLAAPALDAVYIATPNDSHKSLTGAVARAGKHVLCEKPMATNYADASQMVAACERNGVLYATAFDQRFHARHRALRDIIATGKLGTVTHARIHYACWNPPDWKPPTDDGTHVNWRVSPARAGGGAMIDLAPHGLDLLQYLLDDKIVEISCMMQRRVFDYIVDDGASLIGRSSSGALVSINVAYNCPDQYPRRTLEIFGTEAHALAHNTMGQTPGGTLRLTQRDGERSEILIAPEQDVSPFLNQIEAFADAILNRNEFPFTPAGDLHTMKLIDHAQRQGTLALAQTQACYFDDVGACQVADEIAIDEDVQTWFAARGDKPQTHINAVLRKYMQLQKQNL